ncbi:MAG: hypothetical protein QMC23_08520 [Rubritalea sp.]
MITFKLPIYGLLVLVCSMPLLPAQQSSAKEKIRLSFCASHISGKQRNVYLASEKLQKDKKIEWQEIRLNTNVATEPIVHKGARILYFYDKEGEEAKLLAQVKLGGISKNYILLFLPEKSAYHVIAIPNNEFSFGEYHFRNLSKYPVNIEVGGKKKTLLKHQAASFSANKNGKPDWVVIKAKLKERIRTLRQTNWQLSSQQRELIVIYEHPSGNRLSLKHIISGKTLKRPK